jgi:hypothetical protein
MRFMRQKINKAGERRLDDELTENWQGREAAIQGRSTETPTKQWTTKEMTATSHLDEWVTVTVRDWIE